MATVKGAAKAAKPVRLRFSVRVEVDGQDGLDDFARMLRVLYDNGYKGTVKRLVRLLVKTADKRGVAVPPELKEF